jgi:hypothetical protein
VARARACGCVWVCVCVCVCVRGGGGCIGVHAHVRARAEKGSHHLLADNNGATIYVSILRKLQLVSVGLERANNVNLSQRHVFPAPVRAPARAQTSAGTRRYGCQTDTLIHL